MHLSIAVVFACLFFRGNNAATTTRSPTTVSTTVNPRRNTNSVFSTAASRHQPNTTTTTVAPETEPSTKATTTQPPPDIPHPGDCNFDKSWCNWSNLKDDKFDWLRNKGRTTSSSTGPEADITGRGYYAYIEASWPRRPGQVAHLLSPVLNGTQCMRFQYNMYGRYMGDLQTYIKEAKSMIFLWGRYTNQGFGWHSTNVTVYGVDYRVLFVGRVGKSYNSDMAIDGISFVSGTCDGRPLFSVYTGPRLGHLSGNLQEGEPGSCNFDGGYCEWIDIAVGDEFDWTLQRGETATRDTGPLWDHTGLNGNYLYIETSSPRRQGDAAKLLSPRLCGTMCLQLFYHAYGAHLGRLTIYQRHGLATDDRIWGISGDHGDGWHEVLLDISGHCYQLVIEGVTGSGYLGDTAIDDIIFTKGTCCTKRNKHFDVTKGNCSFDDDYCQWKNDIERDRFDWSLTDKGTVSERTGPDGPHSGKGQYAYVESSEPRLAGDRAILVGPVLSGFVCLSFKYHMYGKDIGSLAVFKHGSGVHRFQLWYRKGNMGNLWRDATININCREPTFQIEFEAVVKGWRSDIAIDDIVFSKRMCNKTVDAPIVLDPVILPPISVSNGDCTFPNTFCGWKNDHNDDFDWQIGSGSTPTLETGPKGDVDGNGYYLFMEASLHRYRQKASLSSGYMRSTKCMTFHYHMYGKGVGVLSIIMINLRNKYRQTVWYRRGNQGQHWIRTHVNIGTAVYKISIVAQEGKMSTGDIAVDDISFQDGRCTDTQEIILDDPVVTELKPTVPFEDRSEDCTFDDDHMCKWVNYDNDDFDWKLWTGATRSRKTGPSSGHGGKGMYIYTEASSPQQDGDKARIGLSRNPSTSCVTFYYHMYGENIFELTLAIVSPSQRKTMWLKRGSQGNQWFKAKLTVMSNEKYQLLFEAVMGDGFQGDIALDDITFSHGNCAKPTSSLPQKVSVQSPVDSTSTSLLSVQGDCPDCNKAKS